MVELFEACQQQSSDLERKEMCRARLQQDIQRAFSGLYEIRRRSAPAVCRGSYSLSVFLAVARLYLTGSSMNGLGCRSSDADLCLVLKGNVSSFWLCSLTVIQNVCLYNHWWPCPVYTLVFVSEKTRSYCRTVSPPKVVQITVWVARTPFFSNIKLLRSKLFSQHGWKNSSV